MVMSTPHEIVMPIQHKVVNLGLAHLDHRRGIDLRLLSVWCPTCGELVIRGGRPRIPLDHAATCSNRHRFVRRALPSGTYTTRRFIHVFVPARMSSQVATYYETAYVRQPYRSYVLQEAVGPRKVLAAGSQTARLSRGGHGLKHVRCLSCNNHLVQRMDSAYSCGRQHEFKEFRLVGATVIRRTQWFGMRVHRPILRGPG